MWKTIEQIPWQIRMFFIQKFWRSFYEKILQTFLYTKITTTYLFSGFRNLVFHVRFGYYVTIGLLIRVRLLVVGPSCAYCTCMVQMVIFHIWKWWKKHLNFKINQITVINTQHWTILEKTFRHTNQTKLTYTSLHCLLPSYTKSINTTGYILSQKKRINVIMITVFRTVTNRRWDSHLLKNCKRDRKPNIFIQMICWWFTKNL